MKPLDILLLLLLMFGESFTLAATPAPAELSIDTARANSAGVVEIQINGGLGSNAEKLFQSLSKVKVESEHAMGGRSGSVRQGTAISCSVENDKKVAKAYRCTIKLSTAGESLGIEK